MISYTAVGRVTNRPLQATC